MKEPVSTRIGNDEYLQQTPGELAGGGDGSRHVGEPPRLLVFFRDNHDPAMQRCVKGLVHHSRCVRQKVMF